MLGSDTTVNVTMTPEQLKAFEEFQRTQSQPTVVEAQQPPEDKTPIVDIPAPITGGNNQTEPTIARDPAKEALNTTLEARKAQFQTFIDADFFNTPANADDQKSPLDAVKDLFAETPQLKELDDAALTKALNTLMIIAEKTKPLTPLNLSNALKQIPISSLFFEEGTVLFQDQLDALKQLASEADQAKVIAECAKFNISLDNELESSIERFKQSIASMNPIQLSQFFQAQTPTAFLSAELETLKQEINELADHQAIIAYCKKNNIPFFDQAIDEFKKKDEEFLARLDNAQSAEAFAKQLTPIFTLFSLKEGTTDEDLEKAIQPLSLLFVKKIDERTQLLGNATAAKIKERILSMSTEDLLSKFGEQFIPEATFTSFKQNVAKATSVHELLSALYGEHYSDIQGTTLLDEQTKAFKKEVAEMNLTQLLERFGDFVDPTANAEEKEEEKEEEMEEEREDREKNKEPKAQGVIATFQNYLASTEPNALVGKYFAADWELIKSSITTLATMAVELHLKRQTKIEAFEAFCMDFHSTILDSAKSEAASKKTFAISLPPVKKGLQTLIVLAHAISNEAHREQLKNILANSFSMFCENNNKEIVQQLQAGHNSLMTYKLNAADNIKTLYLTVPKAFQWKTYMPAPLNHEYSLLHPETMEQMFQRPELSDRFYQLFLQALAGNPLPEKTSGFFGKRSDSEAIQFNQVVKDLSLRFKLLSILEHLPINGFSTTFDPIHAEKPSQAKDNAKLRSDIDQSLLSWCLSMNDQRETYDQLAKSISQKAATAEQLDQGLAGFKESEKRQLNKTLQFIVNHLSVQHGGNISDEALDHIETSFGVSRDELNKLMPQQFASPQPADAGDVDEEEVVLESAGALAESEHGDEQNIEKEEKEEETPRSRSHSLSSTSTQ